MKILGQFKDYSDNSIKTVASFNKNIIEMTLLQNRQDTDVVCAPTHHFCNLGCKMCHLTNCKIDKPMTPITKEELLEAIKHSVTYKGYKLTDKKRANNVGNKFKTVCNPSMTPSEKESKTFTLSLIPIAKIKQIKKGIIKLSTLLITIFSP